MQPPPAIRRSVRTAPVRRGGLRNPGTLRPSARASAANLLATELNEMASRGADTDSMPPHDDDEV